ncbi:MAG: methylmalonyl Co-A mutase-associated GTPase MeaB [Flavihumibacter sp.]|nr:methylmalonyl Co-A mutase-associated GTPase MeaB [Flavihumibacter sp.]
MWSALLQQIQAHNIKSLARAISLIENEVEGYDDFLKQLPAGSTPVIGVTGAPGAGKSTLTDALINYLVQQQKKVAVLCVDPSSAFNLGALLGDRIRMSDWYTHPNVYIRSLATRGALGGLHPKIIEITDLIKTAGFDFIIVETVGVGQSEIEIAGLADVTTVVLVPEAGDEIQTMKAGLMEIANVFVVNKADRPDAMLFTKNLRQMLAPVFTQQQQPIAIVKTIATTKEGIEEWWQAIAHWLQQPGYHQKKLYLLAEKAWHLIQQQKMKGLNKAVIKEEITALIQKPGFNLYQYVSSK